MKRRRLFKPIRDRNPITVAIIGLLSFYLMAGAALKADSLPIIGGGTTYTADFTESAGLRPGNEVRVAGVKVGKITGVALDGPKVKVSFRVKDAWVGNASTAAISIKTVLGDKYLAVDPIGSGPQDPDKRIPASRTMAPYDVTKAFDDLSGAIIALDSTQLANSLQTLSTTFANTPPHVRQALTGVSALSKVIADRDDELARLLAGTNKLSGTLAGQNSQFESLLKDGNLLLAELRKRRDAIHGLLVGTQRLSVELTGLVKDNEERLAPALKDLEKVAALLERNRSSLNKALSMAGTYQRLVGNSLGNGRWMDGYLCGVVPKEYTAPNKGPSKGCMPPKGGGR
ncbi:MCE family protein [Thermomonospora umbrina]|uniref:Phospholipid/cholesterol/gamma-HCH transport system substrate-binding protein n=1 Tax=Thermomonospora umbrina TaxID=111806 RepID=A0A3D9SPE8_9ACTN|nr:MCE family protein [Thermomonospora umbrina]REE97809.1 phospholipid/cholesterol/gamma-HCH transport system substrate-binding protein [Thermomonospora umbrina]